MFANMIKKNKKPIFIIKTEYKDYNNKKINCSITPYMNFEKKL